MEPTVTDMVAVATGTPVAPVPFTVTVYVPVLVPAVTVNEDTAEAREVIDTGLGLKLVVNPLPLVTVALRVTAPVKPLAGVTVIVEVPDAPLLRLKDVGEAEIAKFCTFNENAAL